MASTICMSLFSGSLLVCTVRTVLCATYMVAVLRKLRASKLAGLWMLLAQYGFFLGLEGNLFVLSDALRLLIFFSSALFLLLPNVREEDKHCQGLGSLMVMEFVSHFCHFSNAFLEMHYYKIFCALIFLLILKSLIEKLNIADLLIALALPLAILSPYCFSFLYPIYYLEVYAAREDRVQVSSWIAVIASVIVLLGSSWCITTFLRFLYKDLKLGLWFTIAIFLLSVTRIPYTLRHFFYHKGFVAKLRSIPWVYLLCVNYVGAYIVSNLSHPSVTAQSLKRSLLMPNNAVSGQIEGLIALPLLTLIFLFSYRAKKGYTCLSIADTLMCFLIFMLFPASLIVTLGLKF